MGQGIMFQPYSKSHIHDNVTKSSEMMVQRKIDPWFHVFPFQSMLVSNDQKGLPARVLDAKLPERDDRSQHSGSFKGGKLGSHRQHHRGRYRGFITMFIAINRVVVIHLLI